MTIATAGLAVLMAVAAWLAVPAGGAPRLRALTESRPGARGHSATPWRAARARAEGVWASMAIGPGARRRRAAARMRVVRALGALAAEIQAGQVPGVALVRCAGTPSVWPEAAAAATLGGDVAAALDRDAESSDVLRHMAACWRVAADSGAGLAASVERLASSARVAEDVRVELEGQLAGPRATARTLALLPAVGIGFGVMLGADPLAWLLGSFPGRLCLTVGALLTVAGMWWTGRIAASVERLL